MPLYSFLNSQTNETRDVFFKMNDDKVYDGEDGTEVGQWKRVFTVPNASVDSSTKINPFSQKDFVEKTGKKKGTYGDLISAASEASQQRIDKEGRDTVKENFFAAYQKDTGKKHFNDKKSVVEKNGFKVVLEKD